MKRMCFVLVCSPGMFFLALASWQVWIQYGEWIQSQEFNKKFRASDEFKKSVSEDKIESFGKVLQKFFDNEREDYKKDWDGQTQQISASKQGSSMFGKILVNGFLELMEYRT